jgi:hypothetical protein
MRNPSFIRSTCTIFAVSKFYKLNLLISNGGVEDVVRVDRYQHSLLGEQNKGNILSETRQRSDQYFLCGEL